MFLFPRGFPCGVPNSIRFSGGSFPPPGPPSSFGTVCRPPDQRPVVATRRTLGNRAGRVKSRCQDSDALSAGPWIDRIPRPPRQPSRRPRFTSDSLSRRRSCILGAHRNAGWSSSVARWAHNPEVAGSNPVPATTGNVLPKFASGGRFLIGEAMSAARDHSGVSP